MKRTTFWTQKVSYFRGRKGCKRIFRRVFLYSPADISIKDSGMIRILVARAVPKCLVLFRVFYAFLRQLPLKDNFPAKEGIIRVTAKQKEEYLRLRREIK